MQLNLEVMARAAKMNPQKLLALLALSGARRAVEIDERPDVMLQGKTPAVGSTSVMPRYVGATSVTPYYPGGRVGAPAVMEQALGQAPVNYSPQAYNAGDVTFFGFGATSIPALSTGTTFNVKPPRPHTPQQMIIKSTVQGLLIVAISIAGTNILNGQSGVPVEIFSEVSTAPQILYPTIDPSTGVDFTVANPTNGALVFAGAFYGTQVRI